MPSRVCEPQPWSLNKAFFYYQKGESADVFTFEHLSVETKIVKAERCRLLSPAEELESWALRRLCSGLTFTTLPGRKANKKAEKVEVEPHGVQVWH